MKSYIFKHRLFKNTFVYTISNGIRSAIPFLLLPVLTHFLSPSDYGIVATFQVLLAIMVVFIGLNAAGAVAVNFFRIDRQKLKIYVSNAIFISLVSFLLIFSIIYAVKTPLSRFIKIPESWLLIAVIVALSQSISTFALTLWRVEQKALPYGLFRVLQAIFSIGLSLLFIVIFGWRWQGRLLAIVIVAIAFAFVAAFTIYKRRYINFSFNKAYIKDTLLFGIPLIPHAFGGWIIASIDRIFINSMVNVAATGVYVVGYQVGMIIGLLAMSFNQAWSPFLYKKLKENKYSTKVKIVKFTYLYFAGIIALALTLSFFAPSFLRFFVAKNFHCAYKYVFWIALGYAAHGMYFMIVGYIFYAKKTYILAWVTFFSACLNIILNYFLIKSNGAIGAAQATAITFFICFILSWILSAKVYKMPWKIWSVSKNA